MHRREREAVLAETAARAGQEERREGSRARGTSRESRTGGERERADIKDEGSRRGKGSWAKRTKGAKMDIWAQRWTKWHESGQFGTRVDKMAGMEGVARRLQYSG